MATRGRGVAKEIGCVQFSPPAYQWRTWRSTAASPSTQSKPAPPIKVGTTSARKGLEFEQVLIPDIRREQTITQPPADNSEVGPARAPSPPTHW